MPVDPLPPATPCPPPHHHHAMHHIIGRFRRHGIVHHAGGKSAAVIGCAKIPGALPALLPKLIPALAAVAVGTVLVATAVSLASHYDPGSPTTTLAGPASPLPAWPPTNTGLPPIPISEPTSTPLFATAALLVVLAGAARRRARLNPIPNLPG
jgi:hypothetical protein